MAKHRQPTEQKSMVMFGYLCLYHTVNFIAFLFVKQLLVNGFVHGLQKEFENEIILAVVAILCFKFYYTTTEKEKYRKSITIRNKKKNIATNIYLPRNRHTTTSIKKLIALPRMKKVGSKKDTLHKTRKPLSSPARSAADYKQKLKQNVKQRSSAIFMTLFGSSMAQKTYQQSGKENCLV